MTPTHHGPTGPNGSGSTASPGLREPEARPEPAGPARLQLGIQVVANWEELEAIKHEWEELAGNALEPNPSAESWMLIPSLRYQLPGNSVKVVLMYASDLDPPRERPGLAAVFSIEEQNQYRGLPVKIVRLWNHIYSLSPAPLLHRAHAADCVRAFMRWVRDEYPARTLIEFPVLRGNSAFFLILNEVLREDECSHFVTDLHARAFFRPKANADDYFRCLITSDNRKRWGRQERRLSELGQLDYAELGESENPSDWIEAFAGLEMAGWKGRDGTAFGCKGSHRAWLFEVMTEAAKRKQLMMLALRLDRKPVAVRLNVLASPGSYAFKTTYDEQYFKYSPGVLLELENIRRLHWTKEIEWMDSLAGPKHSMIDRLWVDRTTVVSLLVAPGPLAGELALSAIPLFGFLKRRFWRSPAERNHTVPRGEQSPVNGRAPAD